jgi:CHAD domain-containing protein
MAQTATPAKEAVAALAAVGAAAVGGKLAWNKLSDRSGDESRAYRLHGGEFVPDGIRRVARGQIDDSLERLVSASDDELGEAVHETRKATKRVRACLRVARPAIGDETYRAENDAFRHAARRLAGARDSEVLIETLDGLSRRFGDELPPEATARLRSELERQHERAVQELRADDRAAVAAVVAELEAARGRCAAWTFESDGFAALGPGARRNYRRGRRSMRAAAADTSDEHLHDWRKRAKDLWHTAQILRPAGPRRMKRFARRAHGLSDLLGDDHDLAVLTDYVEAHAYYFADDAKRRALLAVIERRREALQRQAFELGAKLYEESPKRFVRSIERRWRKRAPEPAEPVAA